MVSGIILIVGFLPSSFWGSKLTGRIEFCKYTYHSILFVYPHLLCLSVYLAVLFLLFRVSINLEELLVLLINGEAEEKRERGSRIMAGKDLKEQMGPGGGPREPQ